MATFFDTFQTEGVLILVTLALQVTVLAAVALVVSYRYKQNAAIRYGITFSALLCIGVLTVSSLLIQFSGKSLISIPLVSEQWLQQSYFSASTLSSDNSAVETENSLQQGLVSDTQIAGVPGFLSARVNSLISTLGLFPTYQMLLVIWLGGALLAVLRLLLTLHNVDKVRKSSRCLERNDLEHVKCVLGRKNVEKYDIQFRESSTITTPLVVGIFKPIMLLPSKFLWKLNHKQLAAILLHELAHIERKDTKANLIQKLITILFWFHPLVHLLDRQISIAREEICDNNVLEQQSPLEYGEALLHASLATAFVPGKVSYSAGAIGIFSGDCKLEKRIQELMDTEREQSTELELEDQIGILLSIGIVTIILSFSQVSVADRNQALETSVIHSTRQLLNPIEGSSLIPVHFISASQRKDILGEESAAKRRQTPDTTDSTGGGSNSSQKIAASASPARRSDVLSSTVYGDIAGIQEIMNPASGEPDMEAAIELLDNLYESRFERMNSFEKTTILSVYANYYLANSNLLEAIRIFEQILAFENLHEDTQRRAVSALGQQKPAEEDYPQALDYFNQWGELSDSVDEPVLTSLANSYAALKEFESAYTILLELHKSSEERSKLTETNN